MAPWVSSDHKLTGRQRVRRGVERTGLFATAPVCIAQVEEECLRHPLFSKEQGQREAYWRDMRVTDLPLPPIDLG